MPEFKRVTAADNPHPEQKEAQRERDRAEIRRQQAQASKDAATSGDRDAVERESKLGRGPAGLNNGPSNTFTANPRDPLPQAGGTAGHPYQEGRGPVTGGTGFSPPQGPQPTSDKPNPHMPDVDRAKSNPSDEAQRQAHTAEVERSQAAVAEREAGREAVDAQNRTQGRD